MCRPDGRVESFGIAAEQGEPFIDRQSMVIAMPDDRRPGDVFYRHESVPALCHAGFLYCGNVGMVHQCLSLPLSFKSQAIL